MANLNWVLRDSINTVDGSAWTLFSDGKLVGSACRFGPGPDWTSWFIGEYPDDFAGALECVASQLQLAYLLRIAKRHAITPDERDAQRQSWARQDRD
jgi:hypothetical protein